ncbi:organic solute transporter subunit beta [Monodelphis domestica]|uniref:SLC51 subunit beta n=1 Tax=Monodelphis domestica TaxID=13616 RepID=A0A5F8H9V0_MONDO|nr:organic solute transporter subunit beta [Monodelphis domestica]XP_007479643.1 organic solute transporter subunit beta [Monodelphis domestica]
MDSGNGQAEAMPELGWSKEQLEEMLWLYRTEDSTPWNIAVLVLSSAVLILSVFLLGRSITANRNRKMSSQDKQTAEIKSSVQTINKESVSPKDDNSLNILKETLLFESQNPERAMIELKEADISPEYSEANI